MPYAITCPTCQNSLSVAESPLPYIITCPTCRNSLTVPAVAAPVTEPFDTDEPAKPRRRRSQPRSRWPGVLVLVLAALVAVVVIYFATRDGGAKAQQTQDTLDVLVNYQRSAIADKELTFWLSRGVPPSQVAQMATLKEEAEALAARAKAGDSYLEKTYGARRKGLANLDPVLFARWEKFKEKTEREADARLASHGKLLANELAQQPPRTADHLPAINDKTSEMERRITLHSSHPEIVGKWVARTQQENKQMLETLERELRSGP